MRPSLAGLSGKRFCLGISMLFLTAAAGGSEVAICRESPDDSPAAYRQEILLPDGAPARLTVSDGLPEAGAPGCQSLRLPVPAKAVLWASPVSPEETAAFGNTIALQGTVLPERFAVSEIQGSPGDLALSPSLGPEVRASSRPVPRAAWIWSPAAWADRPESIWSLQARHGLRTVYLTIPTDNGTVRHADLLAAFVAEARRRGLAVWPVSGDPREVLEAARPALLSRLAAYADYNRRVPEEARLAGVQLDIEPYLLPGYRLAPAAWRERYLAVVRAARAALDPSLPLDLVMPVWWGSDRDWGPRLLDALAPLGIGVTVMNYRTDPESLLAGARPFLEWGARHRRPVTMALELGPLPDETRRHYRASAEGGELWLLPVGGQPLLLLLSAPGDGLPGRAYRFSHATAAPASRLSFAGDLARLEAAVRRVLPLWAAWPDFAGLALHGLDAGP